jgi:hypothetical protein
MPTVLSVKEQNANYYIFVWSVLRPCECLDFRVTGDDRLENIGKEAIILHSRHNADVFMKNLRKTRRNSVGVAGVPAEILT